VVVTGALTGTTALFAASASEMQANTRRCTSNNNL
jgi:hypothetical protein